jgi:hypothetical protein
MMIAVGDSDLAALAAYVPRVVRGDGAAWQQLVVELEPRLMQLLRRSAPSGRCGTTSMTVGP